jgi:hypothetical protein
MSARRTVATDDEFGPRGVTDGDILEDLRSKCADVRCPVHGMPPSFERQADGSIVEAFCCEVLARIFGELRAEERWDDSDAP